MKTNYVLIDFENVQPASIAALDAEHFHVIVFCGANQTKVGLDLATLMQKMGSRAQYLQISGNGSNALDFHIAFYIGELASREPGAFFHIISKDTGFDPLIAHLKSRKILSARSKTIADMPIFRAAEQASTSKLSAAPPVVPSTSTKSSAAAAKPGRAAAAPLRQGPAERVADAVKDLVRRGNSRPRTVKTLSSTLHALFNKKLGETEITALIDALVHGKHVVVDGTKVTYTLKSTK
jgi:hypothetical protein